MALRMLKTQSDNNIPAAQFKGKLLELSRDYRYLVSTHWVMGSFIELVTEPFIVPMTCYIV